MKRPIKPSIGYRVKFRDETCRRRAAGLRRAHRSEQAWLIFRGAVGRSIAELTELLGISTGEVQAHLERFAMDDAARISSLGAFSKVPPAGEVVADLSAVMKRHAPRKPIRKYVEKYQAKGYQLEVAEILASAYRAAENAIDAHYRD